MKVLAITLAAFAVIVTSQICNDTARLNFRPKMWPDGEVFFCFVNFTSNETEKNTFYEAFDMIEKAAPFIKFTEHSNCSSTQLKKGVLNIIYQNTSECSASVGYPGSEKAGRINFGTVCHGNKGKTCHECCHSLGRGHAHNCLRRDNYLTVAWDCIKPELKDNFCPMFDGTEWPVGHECEFEAASFMAYGAKAGAVNGSCNILCPLNSSVTLPGQRTQLTDCDIRYLKKMYVDDLTTTSTTTTTKPTTTRRRK